MAKKKKGKAKPDPVVEPDEELDDGPAADAGKPRARYDVYFGLTLLTLLILIGAAALLYMDQEDLKSPANAGFNPPTVTAGGLGIRPTGKQN